VASHLVFVTPEQRKCRHSENYETAWLQYTMHLIYQVCRIIDVFDYVK
jgi:hypothetical protein